MAKKRGFFPDKVTIRLTNKEKTIIRNEQLIRHKIGSNDTITHIIKEAIALLEDPIKWRRKKAKQSYAKFMMYKESFEGLKKTRK